MATRKLIKNAWFSLGRQSPKNDITALENKHITLPDEIFTLDLHVLELEGWLLPNIIMLIFKTFITRFDYQKVSPLALREFIIDVCDSYLDVPYHNLYHGTNILHMTYVLLEKCGLLEKLNPDIIFAALIASLVHDIGHPGNTNTFEINTFSELAFKYNDLSVLEQQHCFLAFELIKKHNLNSIISREEFCIFRKTIISCILGTDMAYHKTNYELLKTKQLSEFDFKILDEQILVCKLILHAADIGNAIQRSDICEEWSLLINQEFNNQSIKETLLGLTPTLPNSNCETSFYLAEINYIQFISRPYWEELILIFPQFSNELEQININFTIFTNKHDDLVRKNSHIQVDQYR